MNILTAAAILQLLLAVGGSDVPGELKRVGCYYLGATTERYGTLYPEDIDASICTHVLYLHGAINNETHEIYLKPPSQNNKTGGEGFIPRLVKLKAVNPDLKIHLHVLYRQIDWLLAEPSERSKIIQNGIKWLNGSGFDGLEIAAAPLEPEVTDKIADFLCEMKNEFDKYGYSVATSLVGADEIAEETLDKIARCSDYVALLTNFQRDKTHRIAPMSMIKSNVEWYVERGIPASKILAIVPAFGAIFTLEGPDDTGLGARVHGPGNDDFQMLGGLGIRNKELLRKLNDSSLGWTIRRDNETKEPYAFSNTRLWTSYEDTKSIEYKARYVLENGLGGIDIVTMEFEDDEGIGGEGRFPLTRTIYNTFRGGNQPVNTVPINSEGKMKIITALAVAQLFLLTTGSNIPREPKKVGCFYMGVTSEEYGTLYPEEIDASICSHLTYLHGKINNGTDEIQIDTYVPKWKIDGEGFVPRLVKLKAVKPDLKLILFMPYLDFETLFEPSRRTNIINNGIKWLNESGFDGLEFPFLMDRKFKDKMADLLCDMKSEFDKYGYMLSAFIPDRMFSDPSPGEEDTVSKLARCTSHVSLGMEEYRRGTHLLATIKGITSTVDWFIDRGLPANNIKIAIPSYGKFVRLEDPNETGLGANITGPANDRQDIGGGFEIRYKELLKLLNDSSMGWTIHRDEDTKEVYTFTKTGLWASYEDPESMSFKARYVLEKGLMGIDVFYLDMDDDEGIGGEGRFPLTRAIYNTFRRQNPPTDTTP